MCGAGNQAAAPIWQNVVCQIGTLDRPAWIRYGRPIEFQSRSCTCAGNAGYSGGSRRPPKGFNFEIGIAEVAFVLSCSRAGPLDLIGDGHAVLSPSLALAKP
jgi:hypothetical protein